MIGRKWLPSFPSMQAPSLDMKGMILGPLAFSMITFGVSEGGVSWTSARTLTGLVIGGLSLILFVISCLRHQQPLLELRVFRSSDFTRGIVISWIMQTALFGTVLLFPLLLQQMKEYTPLETGLIMLPQALGSMICMPIAGKIFDRVGARPPLLVGMTLITGALFTMSCLTMDTSLAIILSALFLLGSGMGLSMMALNTHVLNATPRHLVGRVTPLTSASQQVISSFAIAGFTGYFASRMTVNMARTTAGMTMPEASAASFGETFFLATCIAGAGLISSLFLRKPKQQEAEAKEG